MAMRTNRSLERGIRLMQAINRLGPSTLAELQRATDLPKSTIRRLLFTLCQQRIVRQSLTDQKYRINASLDSRNSTMLPQDVASYIDHAVPVLTELTSAIGWPSDIHMISGNAMVILDSTRPLSPFHLHRTVADMELNIFASASGLACLAEQSDEQIMRRISETRGDAKRGLKHVAKSTENYLALVQSVRELGYGFRLDSYPGRLVQPNTAAIALPIRIDVNVFGAISTIYIASVMRLEKFAQQNLGLLRDAISEIENRHAAFLAQAAE